MNVTKTIPGTGVVADSAFPVCDRTFGHIITPMKIGDLERASPECHAGLIAMSNAITSIRQAAEWGVGSTVKCFCRQDRMLLEAVRFRVSVGVEDSIEAETTWPEAAATHLV